MVRSGGNWGDELIWWGAELLADRAGVDWQATDYDGFMAMQTDPRAIVYIHGGGGFNRWSSGRLARAFTKAVTQHRGVVIQGPQTVDTDSDYIADLMASCERGRTAERMVFFTREHPSHEFMLRTAPDWCEVGLDVDTALHVTRDDFLGRAGARQPRYDLYAVREDNEGPAGVIPPDLDAVRLDPAIWARSFDHWLRIHAAARRIVTNRTHSAVAGAVLGVPTVMLAGAYHKNRSMWEFALADRGVRWADYTDPLPFRSKAGPDLLSVFPRVVRESWKVQRLAKRLQGVPLS